MSDEPERRAAELARRAAGRARRAELAGIRDAVRAMIDAFEDASWLTAGLSEVDGHVDVDVIASDATELRRAVREQFGPAVRLNVIANDPRPRHIGSSKPDRPL